MGDKSEGLLHQIVVMLPAFRVVEERLNRETASSFNVFSLVETDESTTSRLLDLLLNPKEAHGQGDLFLRLFISRFVPQWRNTFAYGRAKPASTRELIDVAISDDNHWLGIENKIFGAPEQERQVDRYLDALKSASGQNHNGDYRLIYLSPKGEKPSQRSFSKESEERHKEKFIFGAWVGRESASETSEGGDSALDVAVLPHILDWLNECENNCRADSVRWFLRQFRGLIQNRLFPEKEFSMTGNAIVDLALRSGENLDAALRISEQSWEIKNRVTKAVLEKVKLHLEEWTQQRAGYWELKIDWPAGNWTTNPYKKYLPVLLRRKTWPSMVGAAFSADANGPSDIAVGVMAPTQIIWDKTPNCASFYGTHTSFIDENKRQLIAKVWESQAKATEWWVYEKKLRDIDGQDISNWTKIETIKLLHAEGSRLANDISKVMIDLAQKMESALK